jgi:hypothetical protein
MRNARSPRPGDARERRAVVLTVWSSPIGMAVHGMASAQAEYEKEEEVRASDFAAERCKLARDVGFDAAPWAVPGTPETGTARTILGRADERNRARRARPQWPAVAHAGIRVAWGRQSLAPSSARRAEATRIAHLGAQNRESSTWSFLALRERRAADDAREAAATCARAGSARCSSCRGPVGGLPKGYHLVRHEDHRTESIGGEVP